MNKLISIIVLGLLVVGCGKEDSPVEQEPTSLAPICPINITPSILLYPAIDLTSDKPRFFDNTTYEIIMNGNYLGKFEGNRFNESFLNVTYMDELNIIISAEDEKCYIPNDYMSYTVSCDYTQILNPKLDCADKFILHILDMYNYYSLKVTNNTVETRSNVVKLELDLFYEPDFHLFGCSYDKKYVNKIVLTSDRKELFETYGKVQFAFERNVDDLYLLEEGYRDYELTTYLDESKMHSSFNTTVFCYFYDEEWFIWDYLIDRDVIDGDWNDLGQENPSFNFTIKYKS